jgi:hypothetical protein
MATPTLYLHDHTDVRTRWRGSQPALLEQARRLSSSYPGRVETAVIEHREPSGKRTEHRYDYRDGKHVGTWCRPVLPIQQPLCTGDAGQKGLF